MDTSPDAITAYDSNGKVGKAKRLQGMRIRDEFLCPITYELFRDPVVASDGHTYERDAIEKWFMSNSTSPRTGDLISKVTVPNLNILKLIQDIIVEGGAGLYTKDDTDSNRLFYIYAQKSLILKCLGPPESSWNHQIFQINEGGCVGGRRVHPSTLARGSTPMLFSDDNTVSRMHFEVSYDRVGKHYTIRDLGSAGGTYVRIPYGKKKELIAGDIILLGKHQFVVDSIIGSCTKITGARTSRVDAADDKFPTSPTSESAADDVSMVSLEALMGDAEDLLHCLESLDTSEGDRVQRTAMIQNKVKRIREAAKAARDATPSKKSHSYARDDYKEMLMSKRGQDDSDSENDQDVESTHASTVMTLACFAPEGSPLMGMVYTIDANGATLGRKPTNSVSFYTNKDDKISNIDSAVSQEHARIEMDRESGKFFISDGNATKASTNGTWYRLSPPQQKSAPHELKPRMEILIGTIRFLVSERMTVTEENIDENEKSPRTKKAELRGNDATL